MIDHDTNLSTLSDDELTTAINELSSALSAYQMKLWDCFKEREKRLIQKNANLRAIIDRVRDISNDGNINVNESINESSDNLPNSSTVIATISDNNSDTNGFCILSHIKPGRRIEFDDNNSLKSNASDHLDNGKDCDGRSIHTGDLVEVLTDSKNGKPFKSKEIVLVTYSTGNRVRLAKLDNRSIIGFRDSKNVRLVEK